MVCSPLVHGPHEGTSGRTAQQRCLRCIPRGFDEDIVRGSFTFVYGSPETLVGKPMWRSRMFTYRVWWLRQASYVVARCSQLTETGGEVA